VRGRMANENGVGSAKLLLTGVPKVATFWATYYEGLGGGGEGGEWSKKNQLRWKEWGKTTLKGGRTFLGNGRGRGAV